ncbi:NAD+ diphosphatase [Shimia gijangensis]|uniref:NAD(+) diphosphatase n=1 Tax=Shimia gijangensis TaxID=1470563 RepID=A0A1M6KI12_9RHOB|nr:NAD(+) diphosphatase [Shimia gijangensis]SHJ58588.1 NAD+ diphosphatase [Shimia gijangensis]
MRHAETVTFGGSGLDRAAELRGNPEALEKALAEPEATVIVLWRGKPLLAGADRDMLARLPAGHPILAEARMPPIYLGRDGSGHCFAFDISSWKPDDLDTEALGSFLDQSEQHHPALSAEQVFCELRGVMTRLDQRDAELAATAKAVLSWHRSHRFCAVCGHESEMAMAGWQRNCPSCNSSHFPRTDPVVIMLITHGNKVLMGRSPIWPEGMYSLLAGFVEPGETLEAAVRREVMEEAGITVGAVEYLSSQPWAFPSSLMFGCRGDAVTEEITLDPVELEDAIWVNREDMMQAFSGRHPVLKPARKGAIAHFLLRNWLADRLD